MPPNKRQTGARNFYNMRLLEENESPSSPHKSPPEIHITSIQEQTSSRMPKRDNIRSLNRDQQSSIIASQRFEYHATTTTEYLNRLTQENQLLKL